MQSNTRFENVLVMLKTCTLNNCGMYHMRSRKKWHNALQDEFFIKIRKWSSIAYNTSARAGLTGHIRKEFLGLKVCGTSLSVCPSFSIVRGPDTSYLVEQKDIEVVSADSVLYIQWDSMHLLKWDPSELYQRVGQKIEFFKILFIYLFDINNLPLSQCLQVINRT